MNHVRSLAAFAFMVAGIASIQGVTCLAAEDGTVNPIKEPEVAAELGTRFKKDQAARKEWIEFASKHKILGLASDLAKLEPPIAEQYEVLKKRVADEDQNNRVWLKDVIQKHGWPGQSLVGPQGAHNAWLLVQHADNDREFQQECLAKMEAMPTGEVSQTDIAYLTDRVLCGIGKKQKYGTQGMFKDGKIVPQPIEDEDHVDQRRKALGLEPLADYLKTMEQVYGLSKKSEQE